jgi:hypothetical protein
MTEVKKHECMQTIENLYEKYKDDEYMIQRIHHHIYLYLPNVLSNECINHDKKHNLNSYLTEEQQIFVQVFLSKNNYYYLPHVNLYYEYNGKDYTIVKEDDIVHKLLSSISKDRTLLQWKHKTKSIILKQIKERTLFTSTPETDTIQDVLNALYPTFFPSKNYAKYFLTVIGDNILKKTSDLIHIITPKTRQFIEEIEVVANNAIGNLNSSVKYVTKYHENHSFLNCRLIKLNENYSNEYWKTSLHKIGLNLLCVAAHYSTRYTNSDNFINMCSDEELSNYVYTLRNTTQLEILNKFTDTFIESADVDLKIEWKNLHFIWKQFLSINDLPNVVFSASLKNYLKTKYVFDESCDSFVGIISKYLPVYKEFISFWETTICQTTCDNFEHELEIEEISSLFKFVTKSKSHLSEETIVKILKHFFVLDIVENKYVLNVTSSVWNKLDDIEQTIESIKLLCRENCKYSIISFDDLYNFYQDVCRTNAQKFIVSKRCFEKYMYLKFAENIVYDKFVNMDWYAN